MNIMLAAAWTLAFLAISTAIAAAKETSRGWSLFSVGCVVWFAFLAYRLFNL